MMMGGRSLSVEKFYGQCVDALLRLLKDKLLNGYLFKEIQEKFVIVYEIKSFLKKLNVPRVVVSFILEFRPLLDKISQDLQKKNEFKAKLTSQASVHSKQWALDVESRDRVEELETEIKKTASYDANILKWKQQIEELQSKIKETEKNES